MGLGAYWPGAAALILANALLTFGYLARLGLLIFGGARLGHWSIYRPHWLSALFLLTGGGLGALVLYGGPLWPELLAGAYAPGWWGELRTHYCLRGEVLRGG